MDGLKWEHLRTLMPAGTGGLLEGEEKLEEEGPTFTVMRCLR